MEDLISYFEKKNNQKYNIFKYNNQKLKENQSLVTFNNIVYIIEEEIESDTIIDVNGYFYLIFQNDLDFFVLDSIVKNLYEEVSVYNYNKYLLIKSLDILDIDEYTHELFEAETYKNTYIVSLNQLDNIEDLNTYLEIVDKVLPLAIKEGSCNKFIGISDLVIYKSIILMHNDNEVELLTIKNNIDKLDNDLVHIGINFVENSLNISKTSNNLFLHRNTLIYKLDKIKDLTKFDLKNFKDALIFYLIAKEYLIFKSNK